MKHNLAAAGGALALAGLLFALMGQPPSIAYAQGLGGPGLTGGASAGGGPVNASTGVFTSTVTVGGSLLPAVDIATDLGSGTKRWRSIYADGWKDDSGQLRIYTPGNNPTTVAGKQANGATAIGVTITTAVAYSTDGAVLAEFTNSGTRKAAVDMSGGLKQVGLATGSFPTCNAAHEGVTQYDTTLHKLYTCDGTTWQAHW